MSVANSDSRCAPRTLPYPRRASIRKPTRSRAAMSAACGLGSLPPLAAALSVAPLVVISGVETLRAAAVLTAWSDSLSAAAALRMPAEALLRASCPTLHAAVNDGEAVHDSRRCALAPEAAVARPLAEPPRMPIRQLGSGSIAAALPLLGAASTRGGAAAGGRRTLKARAVACEQGRRQQAFKMQTLHARLCGRRTQGLLRTCRGSHHGHEARAARSHRR